MLFRIRILIQASEGYTSFHVKRIGNIFPDDCQKSAFQMHTEAVKTYREGNILPTRTCKNDPTWHLDAGRNQANRQYIALPFGEK